MREIKFRAWLCAKEIMVPFERMWLEIEDGYGGVWDRNMPREETTSDFELMQYTGVNDKNGVEIYEGDICRNPSGEIGQVVYGNAQFVSWFIPPFDWDPMAPCDGNLQHQVVIGNIYEHPDLIPEPVTTR